MEPLAMGPGMGSGMEPGMGMEPEPVNPGASIAPGGPSAGPPVLDPAAVVPGTAFEAVETAAEPLDPISAAIDGVLFLDPKEAVRRVYQLAASAAKAKAKIDAAGDALDARTYHAAASQYPEVRCARELRLARQRLDVLAGERRRLAVDVDRGLKAGRGSGILDAQLAAADVAMDQVARGVLLFLALPEPEELT